MRFRQIVAVLLIAAMMLSLTSCKEKEITEPQTSAAQSGKEQSSGAEQKNSAADEEKESSALPEESKDTDVPPDPAGADSVKTLLEKSLEFFRSGLDYSKIADVQDPAAYIGYYLMKVFPNDNMSFADARKRAAYGIYEYPERLEKDDADLAAFIKSEMNVQDPQEVLNEYMNNLRDAFKNGSITKDSPNYEKLSALLTDWDKGVDYIFEHYPEVAQFYKDNGVVFSLDDAIEQMKRLGRFELYHEELQVFEELECEYSPENVTVRDNGVCSYDMGKVIKDNEMWMIEMIYYVEDQIYYLAGYDITVGNMGG